MRPATVHRRWPDLLAAAASIGGLAAQSIQTEDPRPPIVYFTVWSAVLVAASSSVLASRPSELFAEVNRAAQPGALLSGLVFWTVLAPTNGIGHQAATMVANLALHAVLPIAVVIRILTVAPVRPSTARRWVTLWFPAAYLGGVLAAEARGMRAPYTFLEPDWPALPVWAVTIGATYLAIGAGIDEVQKRRSTPQAGSSTTHRVPE